MIKKMGQHGFSLVDVILSMLVATLLVGVTGQIFSNQINMTTLQNNRIDATEDVKRALRKITSEIELVEESDWIEVRADGLVFKDSNDEDLEIELVDTDPGKGLAWNGEILVEHLDAFVVTYYDQLGAVVNINDLDALTRIKRLKFEITTEAYGNEGKVVMQSTILPRAFLGYAGFE